MIKTALKSSILRRGAFSEFIVLIVISILFGIHGVESLEYRTFDLGRDESGKVSMQLIKRSDENSGGLTSDNNPGTFSTRTDIRGRYWSKSRRDRDSQNYHQDQDREEDTYAPPSKSNSYFTVDQNGEEINEDACDNRPCISFDRVDREHTFTISMPKSGNGRNPLFKKFVVQPMIQYVVQYDKKRETWGDNTASSTNYEEYEGTQGQSRMRKKHEQNIDRFFNDIDARFEGYWGNDGGGGRGGSEGSSADGYGNGGGYGRDGNNGGWNQDGSSGGDGNYNGGGGVNFDYGFGTGGGGEGNKGPDNQQNQGDLNGFVTAGVYGPPGMTGNAAGLPQSSNGNTAVDGMMGNGNGGMINDGENNKMAGGGMGFGNGPQMSIQQQQSGNNNMQTHNGNSMMMADGSPGNGAMMGMNMGGNTGSLATGMVSTMNSGGGVINMMNAMGNQGGMFSSAMVGGGGINQASGGMGMMPMMPSVSAPTNPGPLYGVPGMTPGQPLGPMGFAPQQQQFQQGPFSNNMGGNPMINMGQGGFGMSMNGVGVGGNSMVAQSQPMNVGGEGSLSSGQMNNFQMMNGGGMSSNLQNTQSVSAGGESIANNGMGGSKIQMGMMAGMQQDIKGGGNNNAGPQIIIMGGGGGSSSSASSSVGGSGSGVAAGDDSEKGKGQSNDNLGDEIKPVYGPPKGRGKGSGSSSYGPPSKNRQNSAESGDGDLTGSFEDISKERPRGKGKKPGSGGGGKKGRGRGRKSLFSSLSAGLPKIPTSIGGHLSFMFSSGFGKGRNKSRGGGGSKPDSEGKPSKPIDKEQVSDHILNILGLTVHHLPGNHSTNNISSEYDTLTNPIVLWGEYGNQSSYLDQLASLLQGDMQDDIAAQRPLDEDTEDATISTFVKSESANINQTAERATDVDLPNATETIPETSTNTSITVVNNVTLSDAIALDFNSSSTTKSSEISKQALHLPNSIPTSSKAPPLSNPIFTTSPRPLLAPPFPSKQILSQFRFRKPKTLLTPQTELFPVSHNTPVQVSSSPLPIIPQSHAISPQPLITLPTPFDPIQEFINENLSSNNVLNLDDQDIINSVSIPSSKLIPHHHPKIEAYYAEPEYLQNPVKIQFDPWLYDALQAAFQPLDQEGSYFHGR